MKSKVHELLYPEKFSNGRIMVVHDVDKELSNLLEKSGMKDFYIRQLRQRYKFLLERGHQCILKRDWFESLKNEKDLYALKVKGIINLRILFCFETKDKHIQPVFLVAFNEKEVSDYESPKKLARKRMEDMR